MLADKKQLYRKLLSPKFFMENEPLEFSPQRFVYDILIYDGDLEQELGALLIERGELNNKQLEQIAREKETIHACNKPDKIMKLLLKKFEVISGAALIEKALEYEDEVIPKVVERLMRNNHDTFIENAIKLLEKRQKDYSPQLIERFEEIQSPYVRSLVCLVIGLRAEAEVIPWMMDRYLEMKKIDTEESCEQGPLLALYEFRERLYSS